MGGFRVCGARGGAREADLWMGTAREDPRTRVGGRVPVALWMELHLGGALGRQAHGRMASCSGAKTQCQVAIRSPHARYEVIKTVLNYRLQKEWPGSSICAEVNEVGCCRYLANDLRIAVEVRKGDDGMVARAEVARAISVLMDDKEMRTRLLKMHGQAHSTLKEGGSSRSNLQILVDSISYHPSQKE